MTTPAHSHLLSMEDDILAVRRWAGVLDHLGCGHSCVQPGEAWVIAKALHEVGKRLERDWNATHKAMRGDQ